MLSRFSAPYREQAVSVLRHEEKSCRVDPTRPEPCPCCSLHDKMQKCAKCLLGKCVPVLVGAVCVVRVTLSGFL